MKIKQILTQHRRDFTATLVCEHCEHEQKLLGGYDDAFYHENVIPNIECNDCGKVSPKDYKPHTPKYAPWEVV